MNIRNEEGIALIVALMAMTLMMALGAALVLTTSSETMIAGNFRNAYQGLYAADAGLERTMVDLLTALDWNTLLDGTTQSAYVDGAPTGSRTSPDGSRIDLNQVVNLANCGKTTTCNSSDLLGNTTGDRPWGANNPVWRLYAYNRLDAMVPTGTIISPYYVVVLIGDDPSETDGNPLRDGANPGTNPGSGVLALRAEALGPRGAHKVIEVTVARIEATEIERGYTGQGGQDAQNRHARKAAVQSPGKTLTMQQLTLATGGVQ